MDDLTSQLKPCARGHNGYWSVTTCHDKSVGSDVICADCYDPNIDRRCEKCNRKVCGAYCVLVRYTGRNLCRDCVPQSRAV